MHEGEVDIDPALVERLVAEQFPDLITRPVRTIGSTGTVNAIYRLGDDLCVRLPRVKDRADSGDRELTWLPRLAPHLTLPIPEPVHRGDPGLGYPFFWAIYRWIEGVPYDPTVGPDPTSTADEQLLAVELASFVLELRRVDTAGAPPAGRHPLADLDDVTRAAIVASDSVIDRHASTEAWDRALAAPAWDGRRTWIHTDLLPTNLLVDPQTGRLAAVIDFGGTGAGDPAADVVPAWSVFGPAGRATYRSALDVDEATWARARGIALHQAALIIPYYAETNPDFVTMATRTVGQVLSDQP